MTDVREQDRQCQQPGVQWQRQGLHWQRQAIVPGSVADNEPTIVRIAPPSAVVVAVSDRELPSQPAPRDSRNDPGRDSNLF